MNIYTTKLISILITGFLLLFGNIQQINYLSIQNRKFINTTQEKDALELKKDAIISQNQVKFVDEIDKKITRNEIQQSVIGSNNSLENVQKVIKQSQEKNINNTVIVAR